MRGDPADIIASMSDTSPRFSITTNDNVVTVEGEIDAHSAPEVGEALTPLPGSGEVRLDLAAVEFIDSSGLRVIIDAHQRAEADERRFVIAQPSRAVQRLIEISGLSDHLNLATD